MTPKQEEALSQVLQAMQNLVNVLQNPEEEEDNTLIFPTDYQPKETDIEEIKKTLSLHARAISENAKVLKDIRSAVQGLIKTVSQSKV